MEFGTSHFEKAKSIFTQIYNDKSSYQYEKAAALIGVGYCDDLLMVAKSQKQRLNLAKNTWLKAYDLAKGTALEAHALWMMACYLSASSETKKEALEYYKQYLRKYPNGHQEDAAKFSIGMCYFQLGDTRKALKYYRILKTKDPNMAQVKEFERLFKFFKLNLLSGKINK